MAEKKSIIGFIGAGNMASAIIEGLVASGKPAQEIVASNPTEPKLQWLAKSCGIKTTSDNLAAVNMSNVIVLAIKPQKLASVCEKLATQDLTGKLIISIAAGINSDKITQLLGQPLAIIRAMPNTPATVSLGATGLFANTKTSQYQRQLAESIFSAVGTTEWVEQESLIDVVTAIAGSAPAYVFQFIESMVAQAMAEGMDSKCARNLATQAVLGAAKLAQTKSQTSLQDLRIAVTSPGGTTAAALASFAEDDFSNIIQKAVAAAAARGRELGEKA